ncbi:hypothetical protein ACFL6Y_04540 [Elusimicrobiota bacterium]
MPNKRMLVSVVLCLVLCVGSVTQAFCAERKMKKGHGFIGGIVSAMLDKPEKWEQRWLIEEDPASEWAAGHCSGAENVSHWREHPISDDSDTCEVSYRSFDMVFHESSNGDIKGELAVGDETRCTETVQCGSIKVEWRRQARGSGIMGGLGQWATRSIAIPITSKTKYIWTVKGIAIDTWAAENCDEALGVDVAFWEAVPVGGKGGECKVMYTQAISFDTEGEEDSAKDGGQMRDQRYCKGAVIDCDSLKLTVQQHGTGLMGGLGEWAVKHLENK